MNELFSIGDLVRFKPKNIKGFRPIEDPRAESIILISKLLPDSKRFFYGLVCSTGEEHLWNYDQVELISSVQNGHEKK